MRASGSILSPLILWYGYKGSFRTLDNLDTIQDDFQYYRNHRSNSWVSEGALHVMPTLTAMEYGEDFLYNGCIDLNKEVSETRGQRLSVSVLINSLIHCRTQSILATFGMTKIISAVTVQEKILPSQFSSPGFTQVLVQEYNLSSCETNSLNTFVF